MDEHKEKAPYVIYEDKNLLVVNKPAGIIAAGDGKTKEETLINLLTELYPELKKVGNPPRYGLVHRLDKDTSGVILIAKNSKSLQFLQKQFEQRKVQKKYLALVYGRVAGNKGMVETLIGRDKNNRLKQKAYLSIDPEAKRKGLRQAITLWKVLKRFKDYTLLEVFPKTGRKHQIRAHLLFLGHPIVGDRLYAPKKDHPISRLFLHSQKISIKLPDEKDKTFVAPLPDELNKFLEKLK